MATRASPGLERRLRREIAGQVLFDAFSRGRYATDASIYQMMPLGVVVPARVEDVHAVIAAAREEGVPILPRGGGTSQCGQTVNHALVVDTSRHLNRILELDVPGRRCVVEPGIVLDELNRALQPHGLWFPVDISTGSRATIGGMAGNNSCGARSIRFGTMRDNVLAIDAILADGSELRFGPVASAPGDGERSLADADMAGHALVRDMLALGAHEAEEIERRFPRLLRRVGGYNIDALAPRPEGNNLAHLLVGSEGTLTYFKAITLKLAPVLRSKVLGVCHFPTFYRAMDAAQHLAALDPMAIELIDSTMIALASDIDMFRATIGRFVVGEPAALLLVEFAEDTPEANLEKLDALEEVMAGLGLSWQGEEARRGGVVRVTDAGLQAAISQVRRAGLNIVMSMKDEGKPVSFVEDCAVALEDLADYTAAMTEIFRKHGTSGTWYAHASVGCLHIRPILNLKQEKDVRAMRAIAEETFALVRKYKGSHSGEHGDGIARSEFHEAMFGPRITAAFETVKRRFDPAGLFNPGKIVSPPRMDDRSLFRYGPDYAVGPLETELDWSAWPGGGGGFQGAVEMCNNNGACRKLAGGVMCPSFRVTRNERDVTRGRANVLRLAISGQLGEDALVSDAMWEAMQLCVSCKACRRECPTGVDMARMKIEVLAARARDRGISLHHRLIAYLPRYAPMASRLARLMNAPNAVPGLARALEAITGFSARRPLPSWHGAPFRDGECAAPGAPDAILFADTFNRYFEPANLRAARRVLNAAGIAVASATPRDTGRPLCCGRTFLAAGLVQEARVEAARLIEALLPHAEQGRPIVGLEPSCLLSLRDELPSLLPGPQAERIASQALTFEEYLAPRLAAGAIRLELASRARSVLLHGHCHQKAFDVLGDAETLLRLVPGAAVTVIESGCCGMAGAFGYGADTFEISMQMGELALFPAIRDSDPEAWIVADGISCRHQIADGTGRRAIHVAKLLEMALEAD